jgi:hypothetical protein
LLGIAAVLLVAGVAPLLWVRDGDGVMAVVDDRVPPFVTATFPLATEVTLAPPVRGSKPRIVTLEGSGTVLFDRYVLTVAHATAWETFEEGLRASDAYPGKLQTFDRLKQSTYLLLPQGRVRLEPLARDDQVDVALFSLPEDAPAPTFPCAIGDSDALRLGAAVLLVERDPSAGPLVRPAAVAALRGTSKISAIAPSDQTFVLTIGLVSGESGSPLLRSEARSCDLVGLAQGTYRGPRQLSWGIRIREAIEALARASDRAPTSRFLQKVCEAAVRPGAFSFCDGA